MRAELGMKLPAAGRLFVAACTGKKTRGSPGNCPTCSAECRRCPRAAGGHGITYIVWSGDLFLPRLSLASWFNVRMSSHWLSDPRAPGILWRFPQLFQGAWWRDSRCCWSERFRGFGGRDSFQRHAADLHAWANLSQLEPKLFFSIFLKTNTWIETWLSFRYAHRTSKKQCFSSKVWTWIKHAALCWQRLQPKSQRHRWRRHLHTIPWPCCSELWSQQPGVQVSPSCSQSAWGANGSHREPLVALPGSIEAMPSSGNGIPGAKAGCVRPYLNSLVPQSQMINDVSYVSCQSQEVACSHPIFLQG